MADSKTERPHSNCLWKGSWFCPDHAEALSGAVLVDIGQTIAEDMLIVKQYKPEPVY